MVVVDDSTIILMYGLMGGFVATFLGLILFVMKTPGWVFIKAWRTGDPIMMNFRRDGKMRFVLMKSDNGALRNDQLGTYFMTEGSAYSEYKTGVTVTPSFSHIAHTVDIKLVEAIGKIKELGIDNAEQLDFVWNVRKNHQEVINLYKVLNQKYKREIQDYERYLSRPPRAAGTAGNGKASGSVKSVQAEPGGEDIY